MNKSESIANLAAALSKAQAEMPVVKMNAKNPFLNNRYADLGAVIDASKPVLSKFGLSISQLPAGANGQVGISSILMHESGEFVEETVTLPPEEKKGLSINQSAGVTITYLRRYAWASILGLYADEDGDGSTRAENDIAHEAAGNIMKSRQWSFEQMDALLELSVGIASDYEQAKSILDLSVLPETATPKTIQSWFNHFSKSKHADSLGRAGDANNAYIKAKGGK